MTTKEWIYAAIERMDEAQLDVLSQTIQQLTHTDPPAMQHLTHTDPPAREESIWKKMQRIGIEGPEDLSTNFGRYSYIDRDVNAEYDSCAV